MADVPTRLRDVIPRRYVMHEQAGRKVNRTLSRLLSAVDLLLSDRRTEMPESGGVAEQEIISVDAFCAWYTNRSNLH